MAVVIIAPVSRIPVVSSGSAVINSSCVCAKLLCCRAVSDSSSESLCWGGGVGGYVCGTR